MFNTHLRYSTTSRNLASHYLHISSFTLINIYGLIILNFCFTGLPPSINKISCTTIFVSTLNMLAKDEVNTSTYFFNNLIRLFFSSTKFRVQTFSSFLFLFFNIIILLFSSSITIKISPKLHQMRSCNDFKILRNEHF
jgi:hypothetical protein